MNFLQNARLAVVTWPPEVGGRGLKSATFQIGEYDYSRLVACGTAGTDTLVVCDEYLYVHRVGRYGIMRDHNFRSKSKMAISTGSSSYSTTETDIKIIRAIPKPMISTGS
jgi:hypothetical protein